MSLYRLGPIGTEEAVGTYAQLIADQEGVDLGEVLIKYDPHPAAPADEPVFCVGDGYDHWPNWEDRPPETRDANR